MNSVKMYSTDWCPYCQRAEKLLLARGVVEIEKINLDALPERRAEMVSLTGRRSVPQIFIGTRHIGGFDELAALDRAGGLALLLTGE